MKAIWCQCRKAFFFPGSRRRAYFHLKDYLAARSILGGFLSGPEGRYVGGIARTTVVNSTSQDI
jgi:hypothetical protein